MLLGLMQDTLDAMASCHRAEGQYTGPKGNQEAQEGRQAGVVGNNLILKVCKAEKQFEGLHLVNDAAHGLICSCVVRQICL